MSEREGKKASSFAIFSIANVLAFVRLLAIISANLVLSYPVVVANVSSRVTTFTVSDTTLPSVVATLPEQETTFTSVVTTFTMQETTLSMSVTKPPKVNT